MENKEKKMSAYERDILLASILQALRGADDSKLRAIYLFVLHIQ